jgi:hypothetical protein
MAHRRRKPEPIDIGDRQLRQLRGDLDGDPPSFPLSELRPVLIPSSILEMGTWVGPYHHFSTLPVSLTWAYQRPEQTMMYLTHDMVQALETAHIDWRREARDSLVREFDRRPWSHEFRGASGDVEGVALLHDDGRGPSRLLCVRRLLGLLPDGFDFYVPERSCALLISRGAGADVRERVIQVVQQCLEAADVPMSSQPVAHELLLDALDPIGEAA